MSGRGRRRRGSGGHPARRERGESRASGPPSASGFGREIARMAGALGSALETEAWASQMLGTFWRGRYELPMTEAVGVDPAVMYGEPLIAELARSQDRGAAIALMAISEVDAGELGMQARELIDKVNAWSRLPKWAADIGESEIVGAAVMREDVFDDARTVFLESRHPDGEIFAVGVLIDNNLGGMAKDVLLADSIDTVAETLRNHPDERTGLRLESIAPGLAAGLIAEAIELTDITWDPPVAEDYWGGRALALLRSDQTPDVIDPEEPPEITQAQRDALRDEFLAAAEGSSFGPDGDESWVAALAIDFCAGYTGGDPLRWSPVVVELFMADWVPRKVMGTESLLACLPNALDAWVRFAARKRGIPDWARDLTCASISEWTQALVEGASDPSAAGPSKQFLLAAIKAGVDLEDREALEGFIAGWNARSDVDLESGGAGDPAPRSDPVGNVLELKITLKGVTKPPVWRRLQVEAGMSLDEFHQVIQVAFGWQDYHLHVFEARGQEFGVPDPDLELDYLDESEFAVGELSAQSDGRFFYTYDFGDDWRHEIIVEKWFDPVPGVSYPALVTAKGACPPEDCGGPWGYEELKVVLADPGAEQHASMREWVGLGAREAFDPKAVDAEQIRRHLAEL